MPERPLSHLMNRRHWMASAAGSGISVCWPGPAKSAETGIPRAKSVIVVFLNGGASQLETFDPKPDAPREIRGEFGSIASAVPGTFVCEHLPRLARLAERYTIVRAMSHDVTDQPHIWL